jgi:hypothetical protein
MRRWAARATPLFALIVATLSACDANHLGGAECNAASWINEPPEATKRVATLLSENRYRLLDGSAKELAVEKLRAQAFYELSPQEANTLADHQNAGGRPFILRAASYSVHTGYTQVMVAPGAVYVASESLGHDPPLQCEAVLAYLDTEPSEVYVTAGLAE